LYMNPDLIQLLFIIGILSICGAYIVEEMTGISIREKARYYYNETLYATGIKERPKKEPFVRAIFKIFTAVFKILTNVTGLAKFFVDISLGTLFLITGAVLTITLTIFSIMKGIWEYFVLILYIIEFAISHLFCFMRILFSAPSCMLWYILETMGKILYLLTIGLVVAVFGLVGIDLKPLEKMFWKFMEYLDKVIFGLTGFHIIHFPRWVRDQCYNCKRLKTSTVGNQFKRLSDIVIKDIPSEARPGISMMGDGGSRFISALKFIARALG